MPLTREVMYKLSHRAEVRFQYSDLMKYVTVAICFDEAPLVTKQWDKRNVVFILTLDEARIFEQSLSKYVTLAEEGVFHGGNNLCIESNQAKKKQLVSYFRGWANNFSQSKGRELPRGCKAGATEEQEAIEETSVDSDSDRRRVWPKYFEDVKGAGG